MATTLNASTSSGLVTSADTSGILQLQTGGTTALTVDASQNVAVGTASPNTNIQFALNGVANKATRIRFQESGVDKWLLGQGAASETSDFELYNANGTMALSVNRTTSVVSVASGIQFPATQVSSANANTLDDYEEGTWTPTCPTTLTTSDGSYIKIGNIVFFSIRLGIASNASGTAFSLSLPFVSNSASAMRSGGWFGYTNGGSATPGNTTWLVNAGFAEINAYTIGGASRACSEFNASLWIGGQFRTA
jgi:hypothetical protein